MKHTKDNKKTEDSVSPELEDNISDKISKEDFVIFVKDFFMFFRDNDIIRNVGLILAAGAVMYFFSTVLNLRFLTVVSYLLGIGLMGFLVYYSYREWIMKRNRYMDLEKKFNDVLEDVIEDEDFQKEIIGKKGSKRQRKYVKDNSKT